MRLITNDEIRKICRNNYEAVLIASQYARKLNSIRIAQEQSDSSGEEQTDKISYKVTSQALYDLIDNKIKISRT